MPEITNPWYYVGSYVSFAEQVYYDESENQTIRKWAEDSFKLRGLYFDGKFWRKKREELDDIDVFRERIDAANEGMIGR